MPRPAVEGDKALIRLPPGMRDELKALAHAGYRSMNAEIVARLRRDIDREKTASEPLA